MENNVQIIELNGQRYTAEQLTDALNELKELHAWENYDYLYEETGDVIYWLRTNKTSEELSDILSNREDSENELNNELWTADSVTGNGSGSYWFSSWKARHALLNNGDLYEEAMEELGEPTRPKSEEQRDVTIRCYLLGQAITAALDQLQEERDEAEREARREREVIHEE